MAHIGCKGIIELDPVQGLIDYVQDVKPFHSKVVEVLIEYVYEESIEVTITDELSMDIGLAYNTSQPPQFACLDGYGLVPYGGTEGWPILNPNVTGLNTDFPYGFNLTDNSFSVLGNRVNDLLPGVQVDLTTYIEDYSSLYDIVSVSPGVAGTASFVVSDPLNTFATDHPVAAHAVETVNSELDDNISFTITGLSWLAGQTVVDVAEAVSSTHGAGKLGMIRTDGGNTGTFTVVSAAYSGGMIDSWPGYPDMGSSDYLVGDGPHTVVTVLETINTLSFTPPDQIYLAYMKLSPINVVGVLSHSNQVPQVLLSSPISYAHTPDEGVSKKDIVDGVLSTVGGSPGVVPGSGQFIVDGNWQSSNVFPGDEITVINSTGNDGTYTIYSIDYDEILNQTILSVNEGIYNSTFNGYVEITIPSNVFIINGDYTSRFTQGEPIIISSGTFAGNYITLKSDYYNNVTRIYVTKNIFAAPTGHNVLAFTSGFVVKGNQTGTFTPASMFSIVGSTYNDGLYTVNTSTYVPYGGSPFVFVDYTIITTTEPVVSEGSGILYSVTFGDIEEDIIGYGESFDFCWNDQFGFNPNETVIASMVYEDLDMAWMTNYQFPIIGLASDVVYIDGNIVDDILLNMTSQAVSIVDSVSNDGAYVIESFLYNGGLDRTEITLAGASLSPALGSPIGSPIIYGYLSIPNVVNNNWFQFIIKEALPDRGSPGTPTDVFEVLGNATGSLSVGQKFKVIGTNNDGTYTVSSALVYNSASNTTDIPVNYIGTNDNGGWIETI